MQALASRAACCFGLLNQKLLSPTDTGIPVRSLDSDTSLIKQAQSLLLTGDEREEEEEPSERMAQEHLEIQRYGE